MTRVQFSLGDNSYRSFESCKPSVRDTSIVPVDMLDGGWIKEGLERAGNKQNKNIDSLTWEDLSQAEYGTPKYGRYLKKMNERILGKSNLSRPADALSWWQVPLTWLSSDWQAPVVYLRTPGGGQCVAGVEGKKAERKEPPAESKPRVELIYAKPKKAKVIVIRKPAPKEPAVILTPAEEAEVNRIVEDSK